MTDPATLRQRFLTEPLTLRNERRDFPEWHRGRPHYVLWALDVDTPAVRARMQAAQRALDGLLLDDYRRQPHVTLALCGFPARGSLPAEDEFEPHRIAAQVAALQADGPGAFDIAIGGLESFSSAPFLSVHEADDALDALRRCLHAEGPHPHGPYVPHVTVGLYADAWPSASVAERFGQIPAAPRLHHRVSRLSPLGYAAAEIGGALFTLAEYELESGRMHWHVPLATEAALAAAEALAGERALAGRHPAASAATAEAAAR
ncbi:MAG: 2'-5' RNA ligase family protein [Thauera sp.]